VPDVERDLAVVVPESRPVGDVLAAIRGARVPSLAAVRLFDIYRGAPLAPGEQSLAVRLRFQPTERSLTDEELDGAMAAVRAALQAAVGGRFRE
jgi:phenylalanyl-tRNA synthetase beta chain